MKRAPKKPTIKTVEVRKRVVVEMRDGLNVIVGAYDPSVHELRDYVEFNYHGRPVAASLITVKPRFIFYREVMKDSPKTFHPEQQ